MYIIPCPCLSMKTLPIMPYRYEYILYTIIITKSGARFTRAPCRNSIQYNFPAWSNGDINFYNSQNFFILLYSEYMIWVMCERANFAEVIVQSCSTLHIYTARMWIDSITTAHAHLLYTSCLTTSTWPSQCDL